jgi:hypothetical protein
MVACGLELEHLGEGSWRAMPPIVRPLIIGRARKTAAATADEGSLVAKQSPSADTRNRSIDA